MKVKSQLNLKNTTPAKRTMSLAQKTKQKSVSKKNSTTAAADFDMVKINLNTASEDMLDTQSKEDTTASNVNFLDNHEDSKESLIDITASGVQLEVVDESKSETKSIGTPVKLIATVNPKKSPYEKHCDAAEAFQHNAHW